VYEALAGKIPFAGTTPTAIFVEVMQGKARPIHELVPGIPLEKSNALMKGITKEPRDRYGSCVEFANAITGSMLARGSSAASSETPSRVVIPGTRMETPKKADIPGTRIETPSKREITGTKIEIPSKPEIIEIKKETHSKPKIAGIMLEKSGSKPVIAGTRLERSGVKVPVIKESEEKSEDDLRFEKRMGKKGNNSAIFVLAGVVGGIALLGIILIIALGGKKATPLAKKEEVAAGIEKEMVLIPAGKFMMGGQSDRLQVTLTRPYYMGRYEVTQEQWEGVMGNNPSSTKGAKLPIENVSWNDCQEFITKLNAKTNGGYRLPTEAEWEYACRAGTTTAYSFGESLTKSDANIDGDSIKAVGSYKPNAFGLHDMHGNVWEWCNDWKADYQAGTATDPKGPVMGERRVLRGGSFIVYGWIALSSDRNGLMPTDRNYDLSPTFRVGSLGFRLARTP
jgi:formylglycine-generating enzyme required for sulfatase activity